MNGEPLNKGVQWIPLHTTSFRHEGAFFKMEFFIDPCQNHILIVGQWENATGDDQRTSLVLDAQLFFRLCLEFADEKMLVAELKRRRYRVLKRKLGAFFDRWIEA